MFFFQNIFITSFQGRHAMFHFLSLPLCGELKQRKEKKTSIYCSTGHLHNFLNPGIFHSQVKLLKINDLIPIFYKVEPRLVLIKIIASWVNSWELELNILAVELKMAPGQWVFQVFFLWLVDGGGKENDISWKILVRSCENCMILVKNNFPPEIHKIQYFEQDLPRHLQE